MFANNDVTIQWLPLSEKFVHKANAVVCYTLSRGCLVVALSIMGRKLPGCPTSRIGVDPLCVSGAICGSAQSMDLPAQSMDLPAQSVDL